MTDSLAPYLAHSKHSMNITFLPPSFLLNLMSLETSGEIALKHQIPSRGNHSPEKLINLPQVTMASK